MNKSILTTGVQQFILENLNTDIVSVLLKKQVFAQVSNLDLAQQLMARKKCENKLPTWFNTPNIYYPDKLNIEQTSSEVTARYKSEIVSGKSLMDATGGWGVDSYFFSQKIDQVYHCEIDENLSEMAAYNFGVLAAKNISTASENGMDFIRKSENGFDWIYIDPSRRSNDKKKVFRLSDCQPDITNELSLLFSKTNNILLKTSPLLDFSIGLEELRHTAEIHVVAVNNEVKELLWILKVGYKGDVDIKTVNLRKHGAERFEFSLSEEKNSLSQFSSPLSFIYEPNAAILKSGAFKLLGDKLRLQKLHTHTHLYTSDRLIKFPGRRFKVFSQVPYNKKNMKTLAIRKANISIRNFSESVSVLRKKFKIDDGGNTYLFFVTDFNDKRTVLVCGKV